MKTKTGFADILIGLQYGDEGKAKVIDLLADRYDVIARFNGGANAGHTIDTPAGRIALKQLPSGVFHGSTKLYIGSGCALNFWKLAKEIRDVEALGVSLEGRLFINSRCAVVQPAHMMIDQLNGRYIGTTGNGMGPCYADRALRMRNGRRVNLQLRDLLADEVLSAETMLANAENDLASFPDEATRIREEARRMADELPQLIATIKGHVVDDPLFLTNLVEGGASVLFEGAQSVMLDVVAGEQPFVTASHTVPGHAYVGGDLSPRFHRKTIGVVKAIMSRVGQGPFPSELGGVRSEEYCASAANTGRGHSDEIREYDADQLLRSADPFDVGVALRMKTHEYGTGTGRPRRIGVLDLVQLRDAIRLHGVDALFVTKCDSLALYSASVFEGFPVVVAHTEEGNGLKMQTFPKFSLDQAVDMSPSDLPTSLIDFKRFLEQETGARVFGFGLGPKREEKVQFFDWV